MTSSRKKRSRFLSWLGRKVPIPLTDIFRIWHGDTTPNESFPAYIAIPAYRQRAKAAGYVGNRST
jgi:hypothetical protein